MACSASPSDVYQLECCLEHLSAEELCNEFWHYAVTEGCHPELPSILPDQRDC